MQALTTILVGVGLSMYYLPKLGAVALAFVPVVGITTYLEGQLMTGQNVKEKRAVEESAKVCFLSESLFFPLSVTYTFRNDVVGRCASS